VAIGLVSDVDAKLGRVKVTFPWMDPPQKSYWAPIASLLSGKKRGARFMPELRDEALIAFDRGEFDHPYVIGFLWNGEDEAPDDVKSNRLVVTPGGHELRFEDKAGDRRIVVKSAAGHTLTLDDKAGKVTLATKSGGKVTLDDQPGKAEVEASQNKITLGPQGVTVEAQGIMNIKSSGVMNVESSAAMTIKAAGLVNLNAGVLSVSAPVATFSGVVQATTVVATSVVSSSYSPGVGNIW
jgi:uncharacterized protein involved in type VI secretion and phage assembly